MSTKMLSPLGIIAKILMITFFSSTLFNCVKPPIAIAFSSKTIYVDAANFADPYQDGSLEHPFDTIQEAVDVADAGDIIFVKAGIYNEYVQIAKSSISLIGQNGTVIDGGGKRNGIRIGALPPNYAENVYIVDFTIRNCVKGVVLVRCRHAHFKNISMIDNLYNFADYSLQENDIDASNTVDGKPIYYWVNVHGKQVPEDAGFVALVNCTGIVIKNLNLTRNGQGIILKNTRESIIEGVNVSSNWDGIYLEKESKNNKIINCIVKRNLFMGIYISASSANTISSNLISENEYGIFLDESSSLNIILNNTLETNDYGLYFRGEANKILTKNIVEANTVKNNSVGISLHFSQENLIFLNNFVNNSQQVLSGDSVNIWDYYNEGNYWSDYLGEDLNDDGIGDSAYIIGENDQDNNPLMGFSSFFSVTWNGDSYPIMVVCTSQISEFCFIQPEKTILLAVTNLNQMKGFCRLTIPTVLLGEPYKAYVNDVQISSFSQSSNGTHITLYIKFNQNVQQVKVVGTTVISEFSSFMLISFLICTFIVLCLMLKMKFKSENAESFAMKI
ncbi:MAG: NosD domain-containing protein [Candidatus Jordarchaeaceae archaeon]